MASHPIFEYYVELLDYRPKIWRRFQTMDHVSFSRLAYMIMALFEMKGYHLFQFEVPMIQITVPPLSGARLTQAITTAREHMLGRDTERMIRIELPDPEWAYDMPDPYRVIDAAGMRLSRFSSRPGFFLFFTYDFGDNWQFLVKLEKVFEDPDLPGRQLPRLLDGAGYGIVEDAGGPPGLKRLDEAFRRKRGPDYRELSEWLGVDTLDLTAFDREDLDFRLKKLPRIFKQFYEDGLEPTRQSINLLERRYKEDS